MKQCPYCGESLEDFVTKCLFCEKLLPEAAKTKAQGKMKWYHRSSSLIVGFLVAGPFILPAVWSHPTYSKQTKIIITVICLIATYYVTMSVIHAVSSMGQYYDSMFNMAY